MSQHDALVDACRKRAQPVIMTTLAMMAGMMPIALGLSGDSSFRAPMAIAVIGGVVSSTLLSLIVVPVFYLAIEKLKTRVGLARICVELMPKAVVEPANDPDAGNEQIEVFAVADRTRPDAGRVGPRIGLGQREGDQALPGPTGFTVDGMWLFPVGAVIPPGQHINVATTAQCFFNKYNRYPNYVFFGVGAQMIPYITYTPNISFALANTGDEVLLLGAANQLVDGVAWKPSVNEPNTLPNNVSCLFIDMNQYPPNTSNPSMMRSPLWKDTDTCPADFVIDWTAQP